MQSTTCCTITLTLSHKEAQWLKDQMQNPLHSQERSEESIEDASMRKAFWEALSYPDQTAKS